MLTKQQFLDKVQKYNQALDEGLIAKAYDFAEKYHKGQHRHSGEDFFIHPVEVASILVNLGFDKSTIIAGLLHDTVEDTEATIEDVRKIFGDEIATLVDGVTKLNLMNFTSKSEKSSENFRKLVMAMSNDIRVLIIKLVDRLHNMRTLHFISREKQIFKANETLSIYVPLAERIGMRQIKNELEDLAFKYLREEDRLDIIKNIEKFKKEKENIIDEIIKDLKNKIEQVGIECTIYGRQKEPYSIWKKMQKKNVSFDYLYDIIAFRIIVDDVADCYRVLGVINSSYKMIPNQFDDYISVPKENGYKSLHTAVFGPLNSKIEVQIRTKEMHRIAEFGLAAHWMYKQGGDDGDFHKYSWIRELVSIFEDTKDAELAFQNTKISLHKDRVFCFTPKGDIFNLIFGSTPVDFAYEIHSAVGDKCIGAKVNGRLVSLKTKLKNGDEVEIITSKNSNPSEHWLSFVKTSKARSEIRQYIRLKKINEFEKIGRSLVDDLLKEEGLEVNDKLIEKNALEKFNKKTVKELYAFVGEGIISKFELLKTLYPEHSSKKQDKADIEKKLLMKKLNVVGKKKEDNTTPIKGLFSGVSINFARCCSPLPGDDIVGIIKTGIGISIHKVDCKNLINVQEKNPEKIITLEWKEDSDKSIKNHKFIARLKIGILDKPGNLANVVSIFSSKDINVASVKSMESINDCNYILFEIDVKNTQDLTEVTSTLKASESVISLERV